VLVVGPTYTRLVWWALHARCDDPQPHAPPPLNPPGCPSPVPTCPIVCAYAGADCKGKPTMTDVTQSPTGVPPLNIPRLSTATPQPDVVFAPQPRRTLQLFGGLQLGEAFPRSNSPLHQQRSYSPQQLQRLREDSRSPGVWSNQTYQDSESRMEAAGLLMDELTALKGKADFHCSNAADGKPPRGGYGLQSSTPVHRSRCFLVWACLCVMCNLSNARACSL
jgi:hypothetical protein